MSADNQMNPQAGQSPATLNIDPFVRAQECAHQFSIGVSTWWSWVKQGKVKPPVKLGARTSVWRSSYIRQLQDELTATAEG